MIGWGMDRLRAFEVFATVVGQGSFTRAADKLDTSPANVTRYVNELEEALGARLLNRTSRRLSLTETGKTLYDRALSILEDVAEAEAIASIATIQPRGRLRMNAPLSFGILHLAPLWPRFVARYPEIELDISLVDRVVDLVEEGYDLAVRISRGGSPALVSRKLATTHHLICASPDISRATALRRAPRISRSMLASPIPIRIPSTSGGYWMMLVRSIPSRCRNIMQTNNGDTARAAALAGLGIIRQPTFLIGEDVLQGRLVPLLTAYRTSEIDILAVYPSRRHLSAKVRVMVDFLVASFRGAPRWDRNGEFTASSR